MIEPRSFQEATRTVTVSYPIPFLVATLLAFWLGCFGGAMATADALRWILTGSGALTTLAAVGLAAYAVLYKPDLLRSERYSLLNRYIELAGDNEMSTTGRAALDRTMLAFLDEDVPKKAAILPKVSLEWRSPPCRRIAAPT